MRKLLSLVLIFASAASASTTKPCPPFDGRGCIGGPGEGGTPDTLEHSSTVRDPMNLVKPLMYVFATIGCAFVALNAYMCSGFARSCELTTLATVVSPNTEHVARLEIEKCNYKAGPEVALRISSKSNPKAWDSSAIGAATSTDLDLTWLSDEKLQVIYPESFHPASVAPYLGGVAIALASKRVSGNSSNGDVAEATRR